MGDADWMEQLSDIDVIHHYAWASILKTADEDPVGDLDRHVRASLKMMKAAANLGGRRIVFASSGGTVYGRSATMPAVETEPLRPMSIYGASKAAVETYLSAFHQSGLIDTRVARISNPYGPGSRRGEQGLVNVFTARALRNEPLVIWGGGEVVRDYIHVSDVADALCRLSTLDLPQSETPTYNIGSGAGASIRQIVALLESKLGRPLRVSHAEGRSFDLPINVLDITRARTDLGWEPRLSLEEGLERLIAALRASNDTCRKSPS